jgi:TonB-linked SusC/RagA family outer membrane protein
MQLNVICLLRPVKPGWLHTKTLLIVTSSEARSHRSAEKSIILAMKLTAMLLLTCCLQVSARGYAQNVTLSVKNVPLEKVFNEIEKQTGYYFAYAEEVLAGTSPINLDVKNAGLKEVLDQCLLGQSLSYTILDRVISIKHTVTAAPLPVTEESSPPVDIHGKVVNEGGEPIPGATIQVKGSKRGTTTNEYGDFTISGIDENAILVVSGVNIERFELTVKGQTGFITIKTNSRVIQGEEVTVQVNNGYQTLAKERSAGSYGKPNMDVVMNRTTSMNVLQRLDGLVPGLVINNTPNSENLAIGGINQHGDNGIMIRGLNSIYANRQPLYVVDGIALPDVSNINPQDVMDITVLKDATAASIYGARASNGVIVITTRKGSNDQKLRVNYNGFVNFQGRPNFNYYPMMNSRQLIQASRDVFDPVALPWGNVNTSPSFTAPHELILYDESRGLISAATANFKLDSLSNINNNGQVKNLWYRNAMLMNHTLSFDGGGPIYSFYGSFAYTDNKSSTPGEKDNTYKINLRQDFKVSSRIHLHLITDLTDEYTSAKRPIYIDDRGLPYNLFKDASGNSVNMPYMKSIFRDQLPSYEAASGIDLNYNPIDEFNRGYSKGENLQARITGGISIALLKGLRFEGLYGYVRNNNKSTTFDGANSYDVRLENFQFTAPATTPGGLPTHYLPITGGHYGTGNAYERDWTVRNQLGYDRNWKDRKHQLTAIFGQEAQEQYNSAVSTMVRGYDETLETSPFINYQSLATQGVIAADGYAHLLYQSPFTQTEGDRRYTSYYANAAYTYNERYVLNGSWRIDQSNLFGKDKSAQNKPVWSAGGKWIVSREKFLDALTWLDFLALRATYGITGNPPAPGTASSYDILNAMNDPIVPGGVSYGLSTPSNSRLTWESTKSLNIGLDYTLLKNRISGTIDLYQKKTSNMIGQLPVNTISGFSSIVGNFGDMKNTGIELSLNSFNIRGKDFIWRTIFNLAYNKNKVTSLNLAAPITTGAQLLTSRFVPDQSAFTIYAYKFAGLDAVGDPQIRLAKGNVTKARNVATAGDMKYMGTYLPVWTGGMTNSFRYKSFGLDVNMIYSLGSVMRRDVNTYYTDVPTTASFETGNISTEFLNRWQKPGDEAKTNVPSYVAVSSTSVSRRDVGYYENADINVLSASYIKFRDITLSYSLPMSVTGKIHSQGANIRLQLSNVILWKANKDNIDPEFQDAFSGTRSTPFGQKTISLGLNVTF